MRVNCCLCLKQLWWIDQKGMINLQSNNKILYLMANNTNDNNLLSFLKNQSLFNQSPNRRMSSRSRDRKSNRGSPAHNQQMAYTSNFNNYNSSGSPNRQQDNFRAPNYQPNGVNFQVNGGNYQNNPTNYQPNTSNFQAQGGVGANFQTTTTTNSNNYQLQGGLSGLQGGNYTSTTNNYSYETTNHHELSNPILQTAANLVTYSSSFESARVETAQRLQGLANKVKAEINSLNYKIEMFNSQMLSVVTQEYNHIKERIYQCVQETFRESESYVREYMRAQEMKFAEEILRARESLQREISSIEAMREDINKPYWRNMAGVFITSEFEARIESVIKQCQTIQTKNIEFETNGFRLKDLQNQLIDAVRNRLQHMRNGGQYHRQM